MTHELRSKRFARIAARLATTATAVGLAAGTAGAADITPVIPVVVAPVVAPPPGPSFYASVALLYMTRRDPAQAPIIDEATARIIGPLPGTDPALILDAQDFDFGWTFGIEGRAGFILPSGSFGAEIGGFWLRPFNAFVGGEPFSGGTYVVTDPPTDFGIDTFEAYNTTRLHGADANLVAHLNGGALQVYAGAAYIRLRDEMTIYADLDAPDQIWTWETSNRLIGPQIGARFVFGAANPFSVEIGGRVGFLHNAVTNSVFIDAATDLEADDADSIWTWMAAGGITARYHLNQNVAITVGYQALWLKDVALAPHQVGATSPIDTDPITLDTFVAPFLTHGLSVGLRLTF